MSQDDKRKEIAKARYIVGSPIQEIADEIGVNRRTIERWASDGNWRDLKSNVVSFQSKPKQVQTPIPKSRPELRTRSSGDLNKTEVIEVAIADLYARLPETEDRNSASLALAIARLVEVHRKLHPPTIADLAEVAIELGFGPTEFLQELKKAWAERA